MTRGNVKDEGGVLWITINSSKTLAERTGRVSISVPYTGSPYCLDMAWRQYISCLPLPPSAPALMLAPTKPLTPERLTAYMRSALGALAFPFTGKATVHSFTRLFSLPKTVWSTGVCNNCRPGSPPYDPRHLGEQRHHDICLQKT